MAALVVVAVVVARAAVAVAVVLVLEVLAAVVVLAVVVVAVASAGAYRDAKSTHRVQIARGYLSIPATHLEESMGRLLPAQPVNILSIPLDPAMQKIVVSLAFSRRQCYLQPTCWTKSPLIFGRNGTSP